MKVFDLETTGFDGRSDLLVEIAIVDLSEGGNIRSAWSSVVRALPMDAHGIPSDLLTRFHGIGFGEVSTAPTLRSLSERIAADLDGEVVIGHNARRFDLPFLQNALARIGVTFQPDRVIDTLERDRVMFPDRRHTLTAACEAYGIPLIGAHRALADTIATARLATAQSALIGWGGR